MISLARARSRADSYEVGCLHAVPILRHTYCPAEPATSSMDIALRAAGICMEQKPLGYKDIELSAQLMR
jgi:hypothetical protein